MATKTKAGKLKLKAEVTLTAHLVDHVLAYRAEWDDMDKCFNPPGWARTRTSTLRGVVQAVIENGTAFFTRDDSWRAELNQDERRATLAVARRVRQQFFPEL